MSRMIPSQMSDEEKRKSKAEWKIFEWLREMEWGDAIVLHSLPLKEHDYKSFGEIDFVVICERGVLCIEVKGGRVCRQNGMWQFINRDGHVDEKKEGPYKQVQGNMNSLRNFLEDNLRNGDSILKASFASCVMMPDCIVSSDDDTEIIREITFDQHLEKKDMVSIFERSFRYWDMKTPKGSHEGLSKTDRERLLTFLRGNFSFVPKLSLLLKASEEQLCTVTDQQFLVIAGMSQNDRMMIEGGAGTGKTFLAMEQCKKYSVIGNRVLFLCFNSLIASYLRESIKKDDIDYTIEVMTFHELLMKLCGEKKVPEGINEDDYFNNFLPNTFLSNFASLPEEEKYDRMVIDEGQDLMNINAYMCLDNIIKGGWKNGKWAIYYDPQQNIFNTNEEFSETWKELKADSFIYPLTVNCRNTRQIAKGNYAVTHVYNPPVMQAEGEEIEYIAYKDKKDELKLLCDVIRKL
ncbi:MAG: NERD domain-containing protein, partial [Lachnospiraceae bacterium]|nr:NERD domain-containing protein [Lachnospiraceae bacterium]